jgi:hypothetical protein
LENCYPWITGGTTAVTEQIALYSRYRKRAMTNGLELAPKIVHQKILELFNISVTKSQDNTKGINRKKGSSFITIAKNRALPEKWYVDSGSSNHVTPNKNSMIKFSTNAAQISQLPIMK